MGFLVLLLDDAVPACQEFPTDCLPLIWVVRGICHLERGREMLLRKIPRSVTRFKTMTDTASWLQMLSWNCPTDEVKPSRSELDEALLTLRVDPDVVRMEAACSSSWESRMVE